MDLTLSRRISELRRTRGLTQEQLGRLAGVSAQAVSKWEKGGAPDVELLPEPTEGYKANFAPVEEYRRLFAALAMDGALESLMYMYSKKQKFYTAAAVARRAGLDQDAVEAAFIAMTECHLLTRQELEMEEGTVTAYAIRDNQGFVPFLYFARWFMEEGDAWSCGWHTRERPILARREEKEDKHEKE